MRSKWGKIIFILLVFMLLIILGFFWIARNIFKPVSPYAVDLNHQLADRSFVSLEPCNPPCWHNLELNQSTTEDVYNVLNNLPFVVEGSIIYKENLIHLQDGATKDQIWFRCPYFEGPQCGTITVSNNLVEEISTIVAYSLTVDELITLIGPPDYVKYDSDGHGTCLITLNYPLKNMMFDIYIDNDTSDYCGPFFGQGHLDLNHQIDGIIYQTEQSFDPCGKYITPCFPWDYVATSDETLRPPALDCESIKNGQGNKFDITDLKVDLEGSIWISTYGEGIFQYIPESKTMNQYTVINGLVDNRVGSLAISQEGWVWAATIKGLSRFDGASWQSWTTEDGLINEYVYSIDVDSHSVAWIGTQGGISSFDPIKNEWKNFSVEDGLPDDHYTFVKVTPDDQIWFDLLSNGLIKLTPTSANHNSYDWVNYSSYVDSAEKGIPFERFNDIAVSQDGSYWFAASSLFKYDPNTKTWEEIVTPYFYSVEGLEFTDNGTLWIVPYSHEPRLVHWLSPTENIIIQDLRFYDSHDGLPRLPESATNHDPVEEIAVTPDGKIWIATREHITQCNVLNNE